MTRHVAIFIFDEVEVLDFAGPFEVFNVAGQEIDGEPFTVNTVAATDTTVSARGKLQIQPDYTFATLPQPDILVIPGGAGTRPLVKDEQVIYWVQDMAEKVEFLLSVCTGSLLLAKAGVLDNLTATTHHDAFDLLAKLAPTATVDRESRFVDAGNIITSGGISAGIDMALHVVERLVGEEVQSVLDEMEYQSLNYEWSLARR